MNHTLNNLTTRAHIEGADIIPGCRVPDAAWRRTRDGRVMTIRVADGVCTVEVDGLEPFTGTEREALRFITRTTR